MSRITQVATWKARRRVVAIQFTVDGQTYTVNHVNIPKNRTDAQLEAVAAAWAAGRGISLGEFHVHRNRDDSFCVTFGPAPDTWLEDEPE